MRLTVQPNPVPTTLRWSFSQWESYQQCPSKWNFQSRMKLPRKPAGPAAARGLLIHDSVEQYINGGEEINLHPAVDRKYIPILDAFRNHPNGDRHTEKKLAFDNSWYLCAPDAPTTACVGVLDAARFLDGVLHVGEWKSGKPKDTHVDQRKLYAMFGMRAWNAERVEVTTYYLEDTARPQRLVLASETGYDKLKAMWDDRTSTMRRDQICAPRPGFYCRWCDYSKSAGGPCPFGV